jgi:hypothetical protein
VRDLVWIGFPFQVEFKPQLGGDLLLSLWEVESKAGRKFRGLHAVGGLFISDKCPPCVCLNYCMNDYVILCWVLTVKCSCISIMGISTVLIILRIHVAKTIQGP